MDDPSRIFCDQCGLCCRMITGIAELKMFDRGDGVCMHLQGNTCSIYNKRPNICNSKYMFEHHFSRYMTADEFIKKNKESCIKIKQLFYEKEGNCNG